MRIIRILLVLSILGLVGAVGWQIASSELANIEIQDDMRDLASQLGRNIGLSAPPSDEDLRKALIHRAEGYGVDLHPSQIKVQRRGSGEKATVHLSADYIVPIRLGGYSFPLHFTPSSGN